MRRRSRSYERFSNYLLLWKLETDSFSELWRAAPVEALDAPVALRRFRGGAQTWSEAAERSRSVLPFISGTVIAQDQRLLIEGDKPFLAHSYEAGRPLATIAHRAFGSPKGLPLSADQALTVAEKIALSLVITHDARPEGARAVHGLLLPPFIWVSEDGSVRVAGQGLGAAIHGLVASGDLAADIRPFVAPEVLAGGAPDVRSDIFAAGAILYLLLTGKPLADPEHGARLAGAVRSARLATNGQPLTPEVSDILRRTIAADPSKRYASALELQQDISRILFSGSFTATTFNLAFFVQSLLRTDFEQERKEREVESAITLEKPLAEERSGDHSPPFTLSSPSAERSSRHRVAVLSILAVIAALSVLGVAWKNGWIAAADPSPSSPARAAAPALAPAPKATPDSAQQIAAAATASLQDDLATREAAFEKEVNRRLRDEMVKLQRKFDEDERKRRLAETRKPLLGRTAGTDTGDGQPASSAAEAVRELAREGQLVDLQSVDEAPTVARSTTPLYPAAAARDRIEGSVIVTALISETGRVLDARVLRGDSGNSEFDDAALRAVRTWQFNPAIKDRQRVRTWVPVNVTFKLE